MSKDYDFINSIIAESHIHSLELEVAKLRAENAALKDKLKDIAKEK